MLRAATRALKSTFGPICISLFGLNVNNLLQMRQLTQPGTDN